MTKITPEAVRAVQDKIAWASQIVSMSQTTEGRLQMRYKDFMLLSKAQSILAAAYLAMAEDNQRLRERVKAADRLAASIDSDMGKLAFSWETVQSLAAYRATEERG